jgi:acyl-CoA thioesterase FadM
MNHATDPRPHGLTSMEGSWSTELQPWWRDFDELGHMTAAAYPAAYEEGVGRFVTDRWGPSSAAYVTASTSIEYLREVRRASLPITIQVRPAHVGRTSFVLDLVLLDAAGRRCSTARSRYVAWDRERRGPRPLGEDQRSALLGTEDQPEVTSLRDG